MICRCSPFAMPDNVGVNRQLNRQQKRGSQARYAFELWCLTPSKEGCPPTSWRPPSFSEYDAKPHGDDLSRSRHRLSRCGQQDACGPRLAVIRRPSRKSSRTLLCSHRHGEVLCPAWLLYTSDSLNSIRTRDQLLKAQVFPQRFEPRINTKLCRR